MVRYLFPIIFVLNLNTAEAQDYKRATDDTDNVKGKLYPKKGRLEISGPVFGSVLNQSYIDTSLVGGGLSYYWSEEWGLGFDALVAMNTDKLERECIENFYNDPEELVASACASEDVDKAAPLFDSSGLPIKGANFGPAYVSIRELESLISANLLWNPVYGKQLAFLSTTSYFDLYFKMGLGLAMSTFYPSSQLLLDGRLSRGSAPDPLPEGCPSNPGVCPDDPNVGSLIGIAGRPIPESQTNLMISGGIGQKLHFFRRFHLTAEAATYTLLGVDDGVEIFVALLVGGGVRF